MCWGVMIVSNRAAYDVARTVSGLGLGTRLIGSMENGRLLWTITASSDCDEECGCELFRERVAFWDPAVHRREIVEARERRYRRQGWSEAKIARALRDAKLGADRPFENSVGLRPDAGRVFETVTLKDDDAEILLHFFTGSFNVMLESFAQFPSRALQTGLGSAWCEEVEPNIWYRLESAR